MGRPPFEWTEEMEVEIFDRIAKGEAIRNICTDDWLPSWATVNKRLAEDEVFAARYARSREEQADAIFDEVQAIADQATPENVSVARLQVDVRKWRAGKLRPKVYGDKFQVGGADDLPPIQTEDAGAAKLAAFLSGIAGRSAS